MTKICKICNENKGIEMFYRGHAKCKPCYCKILMRKNENYKEYKNLYNELKFLKNLCSSCVTNFELKNKTLFQCDINDLKKYLKENHRIGELVD